MVSNTNMAYLRFLDTKAIERNDKINVAAEPERVMEQPELSMPLCVPELMTVPEFPELLAELLFSPEEFDGFSIFFSSIPQFSHVRTYSPEATCFHSPNLCDSL